MLKGTSSLKRWHRLGEPLPRRVVIFQAQQLGDLLCSVPALRALRAALPNAEIVLVGLPWAKAFVERFHHYVDGFREFPGYAGPAEQTPRSSQLPAFVAAMQNERFDLALQLHGSGSIMNPLMAEFGARLNAGFFLPAELCPDKKRFLPYPGKLSDVQIPLRLLDFLGIPSQGEELEFPLVEGDYRDLRRTLGSAALQPGAYVCLHPGARAPSRRWSPGYFAEVADTLARRGLRIVLTGSADEAPLTAAVRAAMHSEALDLAGKTSIGMLGALVQGSRLLVCNDTGVAHLAAALRVPSVVIFHRMSELQRSAAPDRQLHRPLFHEAGIRPAQVLEQAEELLQAPVLSSREPQTSAGRPAANTLPAVLTRGSRLQQLLRLFAHPGRVAP